MKPKAKAVPSGGEVTARVVLDEVAIKQRSKINAKEINRSVQSDLKLLKRFSFI